MAEGDRNTVAGNTAKCRTCGASNALRRETIRRSDTVVVYLCCRLCGARWRNRDTSKRRTIPRKRRAGR